MSAAEAHLPLTEAPAGVSSARQTLSQEPSFTRKRKVHDSDSQTAQECVLQHGGEDTNTNNENPAVLFKAGQRRPLPAPNPSEYQLQFTWKSGGLTEAPLVAAEKLIGDGESKKKGETMGVRQRGKGRGGGGGKEKGGGKLKEREKGENQRSKVEIKVEDTDSRNAPPQNVKKPRFNGTSLPRGGSVVQRRSPSKSPQRESQRQPRGNRRHGRGKKNRKTFTGQTEYRAQFKAWPISSEPISLGKRTKNTVNSKKRSDITDPRLATPPPLPDSLPGPLKSGLWGTEYSTRFKSPLNFQYVRGAWMESPQSSPLPDPHYLESGPNLPESDRQGEKKEKGEDNEQPISPQESLLAQLSEIRRKATEYRQRSEMCHIIPVPPSGTAEKQHEPETEVAVKDAQSLSLSASPSVSRSSSLSSLNNNGFPDPNTPSRDQSAHLHMSQDHTLTNGGEVEEGGEGSEEGSDTESSVGQSDDVEKDSHFDDDISHKLQSKNDQICKSREKREIMNGYTGGRKIRTVSPSPPPTALDSNGRVPTPILRENSEQMRHHLDRTTPTSGSVLTSPPLPAFLKPSRVSTSSRTTGNIKRTGQQSKLGAHSCRSTSHLSKGKRQGEKAVASKQWNSGLYLSRGSPKLKHDRSLVSSVNGDPRSSSSRCQTRPKSTTSHLPKMHPPSQSHPTPPPLGTAHHTLTTTHPAHSLSSVSSLLSSVSNSSSPGAVRRLDYNANTRAKAAVNPVQPPQSRPSKPHSHVSCTNAQCDICGAWLRKSQTLSTQHLNVNSYARTNTKGQHFSHAQHSTAPTHQHKGTLTNATIHGPQNSNIHSIPQSNVATIPSEISRPTLREPDELSISSLSLSSCSIASDLLKKARERRERFWTQPNTT